MVRKATTYERARRLIEKAESQPGYSDVSLSHGYAEPGYTDPESGVIALGNWNPRDWDDKDAEINVMPKLAKALEDLGVELEWSDEWLTCDECQHIFRCKGNSYHWQQSGWQSEDETLCQDCILESPETYLQYLEGNYHTAATIDIDLSEHGYVRIDEEYENGLYGGQDASPEKIAHSLSNIGVERFLFKIDSVGQFDLRFSCWIHESEFGKFLEEQEIFNSAGKRLDEDPADQCKRYLQDAAVKIGELPDGHGVKVAQMNPDGTAKVKLVSPKDFIAGKALD